MAGDAGASSATFLPAIKVLTKSDQHLYFALGIDVRRQDIPDVRRPDLRETFDSSG